MKKYQPYLDIILIAAGFTAFGYLFSFYPLYILAGIILLSATYKPAATFIVNAWKKFGKVLGYINSRIMLTLFFIFFITPFSLLYKLFSRKENENEWKDVSAVVVDFTKPW